MFAFCLYDLGRERILLARDRMGIKPLYIYRDSKLLVFGSEIKGILACKDVHTGKETNVLDEYLCFRSLANNRTFFANIKSLEPGTCLEVSENGCLARSYWRPDYSKSALKDRSIIDRTNEILRASVLRQMVSDVPLGSLLSGGVDSSWVSAVAAQCSPGMHSFTVGFNETQHDERVYAKALAKSASLQYHEIVVDHKEFAEALPKAIRYHDEPLNHANSVQIYLICRYAKQFVKVLLTGEGADELFGGYPRYYISRLGFQFLHLDPFIRRAITLALALVPSRKSRKLNDSLGLDPGQLIVGNAEFARQKKVAALLNKDRLDIRQRSELLEKEWLPELSFMDNLLLFEQKTYLQSILARQDKMSMAASIESRVPFLDNDMIALAAAIPAERKIKNLSPKFLLKRAAERDVPKQIIYRKKVGFGVPIGKWLTGDNGFRGLVEMVLDQAPGMDGINRSMLAHIVKEHRTGKANHEDVLWPLINYSIWQHEYFS
jgi:asparagine synthase (glutamine-hydrolysing)